MDTRHFEEVDINTIQQIKPRSVGAEHVSLEALKELQIPQILEDAGFNGRQLAEALGNIIGRMCAPRSERATAKWLKETSVIESVGGHQIHLQRQPGQHEGEVKFACWSEQRAMKDKSINTSFQKKYEKELNKLRTTLIDWDDEALWRTYTMLTDLESVFRSLKSELGMRPVYHHKEDRCDPPTPRLRRAGGHLFI